jgi:hypothetical protein
LVRPCSETRRGVDGAAVEETMPVSCETSLSEIILPEKDSPGVREGVSIEDGAAKKMSGLESEFRCAMHMSRHVRVMRAGFVRRARGCGR